MAKAVVIASALASALLVSSAARAADPPPVNPAIQQYVEQLPTSGGDVVPGKRSRAPLPKRVARALRESRSPDAPLLRNVASSSAYGAPQVKLHATKRAAAEARRAVRDGDRPLSGSSLGAAVDAVGAGWGVAGWLALALVVITTVGAGAAVARARR